MLILRAITKFLTSTRVAIVVMVIVTLLSLIGAMLPQGAGQQAYIGAYGKAWGNLVWHLGFTDIFRAKYFSALLVFLCIMVFACSLKSLPRRIRLATRREYIADHGRLSGLADHADLVLGVDQEEAVLHIKDICRKRLYSVASRTVDGSVLLSASRMGFSRYGSLMLHLSFIFILIGAITSTRLGSRHFREAPVGDEFALSLSGGEEITVMVEDFNVEFDDNDHISDFICDVALARQDTIFMRHSIRPNHPLKYGGREIYLQSYSEAMEGIVVTVYDSLGQVVLPHLFLGLDDEVYVEELGARARIDLGMVPTVRLRLDNGALETYVVQEVVERNRADRYQFVIMYAVPSVIVFLEVVREPFQGFIYMGFALLTLGTFISLYLSHRRIWFKVDGEEGGRARVAFGGRANRGRPGFKAEFEAIKETLDELA
ncbi:MAG: cytochrome c biogenesis protein ResB [bacterium]